jgi:thiamine-monophosphate kinase
VTTTSVADCGERALIARVRDRLAMPSWVVIGPGDDAAVVEPVRGALEVWTTDAQVEGVHFDRRFVSPEDIGHRAMAVNLSDLAAMGARPRAALLSLALPATLELTAFDQILDGMLALGARFGVTLVGGNVTFSPGPLMLDVTAVGTVHPRRILTRARARAGDQVFVTGSLGDAAAGLAHLQAGRRDRAQPSESRYLRPEPRVRAGILLGSMRTPVSCVDLSDGLADGVRQLAEASGVGVSLDATAVPVTDALRTDAAALGRDALDLALTGGDDYELLFTVRSSAVGRLRGVRGQMDGLALTRIGVVTKSRDLVVRDGASTRELPQGFEHFR